MQDYKGKKLFILAGAAVHTKVVKAAKELGIYTIEADYLDPKNAPAKQIVDEYLTYNIFDIDEIVDYIKTNLVDGVLGFCIDPTQRPAQKIAEKAGVPAFGTWVQVMALTDRTILKKLCTDTNVDITPSYTEEYLGMNIIQYPALVKPVDSRGSRGAKECYNENELREAIPNAKYIGEGDIEKSHIGSKILLTIAYAAVAIPILISIVQELGLIQYLISISRLLV